MNCKNWQLRDPTISAKGAKSCSLVTDAQNTKSYLNLGSKENPLRSPFGATSFNDEKATRKTIEFTLDESQAKIFKDFDSWAMNYLASNSERLFKQTKTLEEIRAIYKSPVSQKADYKPHLRCKINTAGAAIVRCWDEAGQKRELPEDLRNCELVPRIHISHLWIMAKECGWVLKIEDLRIVEKNAVCPF